MPRCTFTNFPALTYLYNRPLTVCSFSSPHNKATSLVEKTVLEDRNKTSTYSPLAGLLFICRLEVALKVSSSAHYMLRQISASGFLDLDYFISALPAIA